MRTIKILFVCHGNICRSPIAEFVLKHMVANEPTLVGQTFHIESAAVSREEIGNGIYPQAKAVLCEHGVPFHARRARQMTINDYEHFDRIYVMDQSNMRLISQIIGEDSQSKVRMLLDRDVADPWYTGDFESCYQDIVEGCRKILEV